MSKKIIVSIIVLLSIVIIGGILYLNVSRNDSTDSSVLGERVQKFITPEYVLSEGSFDSILNDDGTITPITNIN
jgi:hypothetical protein